MSKMEALLARSDVRMLRVGELTELPGDYRQGKRPAIKAMTVHYGGTAQPGVGDEEAEYALLHSFAKGHTALNRFGRGLQHDGLAYDAAVGCNFLYILPPPRPFNEQWHGGNTYANRYSSGLVFLLGGEQRPTSLQYELAGLYLDARIEQHGIAGRSEVYPHNAWAGANTACPGVIVPDWLNVWKSGTPDATANAPFQSRRYYVTTVTDLAVRTKPGTYGDVMRRLPIGAELDVDFITRGTTVKKTFGTIESDEWLHLREGGYVSALYADLVVRTYTVTAAAGARVRATTNASAPLITLDEYGGVDTLPYGMKIRVAEELAGDAVDGYPSAMWLRLAGRTVYIKAELAQEA